MNELVLVSDQDAEVPETLSVQDISVGIHEPCKFWVSAS